MIPVPPEPFIAEIHTALAETGVPAMPYALVATGLILLGMVLRWTRQRAS